MARPSPIVLAQAQVDNQQIEILHAERKYILTFQGQPCNIRKIAYAFPQGLTKKYLKTSYAHLGSVVAQVKRLNKIFATDQFSYAVWPPLDTKKE
jgi:hypothetical protein